MNTGRNLNIFSWAIVIYLLSGADIQSLGISGIGLKFEHVDVIKFAAVLLWFWMIVSHFITRGKGEYYEAWVENAKSINHEGILQAKVADESGNASEEKQQSVISEIEQFFGKKIERITMNTKYELAYLRESDKQYGVYLAQKRMSQAPDLGPGEEGWVPKFQVVSSRYSTFKLHLKFPKVFFLVLNNNADVFLRRVIPWGSALIALTLLLINTQTDVSEWYTKFFGEPVTAPCI